MKKIRENLLYSHNIKVFTYASSYLKSPNDVLQITHIPELDKELHLLSKKRLTLLLYII